MVRLLGSSMFLNVVKVFFRVKQLFKNTTQRSTHTTANAATQTPVMGDTAEPENQSVPLSVAHIQNKKYRKESVCLKKD